MSMVGRNGPTGPTRQEASSHCQRRLAARAPLAGSFLAATVVVGAGLAACDSSGSNTSTGPGSSTSATELAARSRATMTGLTSFRVTGDITTSSQHTALDLILAPTASGGTITTSHGSFQLISDGSHPYLSAPRAFWTNQGVPAATAQTLAGKWVTGFPAAETKTLTRSLDVE